jgi:alpha-1,4-digalacturonate transport system permease protein
VSTARRPLLELPAAAAGAAMNMVDVPMRAAQRLLGVPRIAWMFVAPNLAILGLFTFLPIVVNF